MNEINGQWTSFLELMERLPFGLIGSTIEIATLGFVIRGELANIDWMDALPHHITFDNTVVWNAGAKSWDGIDEEDATIEIAAMEYLTQPFEVDQEHISFLLFPTLPAETSYTLYFSRAQLPDEPRPLSEFRHLRNKKYWLSF